MQPASPPPTESSCQMEPNFASQNHPLETAGVATRGLVLWMWPMLRLGWRRPLSEGDVWPVPSSVRSAQVAARLERFWHAPKGTAPRSLASALTGAWTGSLLWILLAAFLGVSLFELPPLLVGEVLASLLEGRAGARVWALMLSSFACVAAAGLVICSVHRFHSRLGLEVRSALASAVYRQVLRLGGGTCSRVGQHSLSGFCSQLVGVDCERAYILCHFGLFLLIDLLMIAACMPLLVYTLGAAGLWGCAVLLGGTLAQRLFMCRLVTARKGMQACSDRRLAATQELLENVRGLKMTGLENPLHRRVGGVRDEELAWQRRVLLLRAVNGSFTYCLVHLCLLAVLAAARQVGQELALPQVFAALAFLNANRVVFTILPFELAAFSEGLTSLGRIQGFLRVQGAQSLVDAPPAVAVEATKPQLNDDRASCQQPSEAQPPLQAQAATAPGAAAAVKLQLEEVGGPQSNQAQPPRAPALQAKNALFAWGDGEAGASGLRELRVPSLEVAPGQLVVVVGPSGSGKSSLCAALLGWMPLRFGTSIGPCGPAGLCLQEPWVLSGTVHENVLGQSGAGDDARLWEALELAGLQEDVRALPGGADCEIGFRGLNLSGGQKARLALARALALQSAEVLVLDDVLSSLDVATAHRVVQRALLGGLRGRTRVVALNSHYEALLPHADVVVLVERGRATAFERLADFEATDFARLLAANRAEAAAAAHEDDFAKCPAWIAQGLPDGVVATELVTGAAAIATEALGDHAAQASGKLYEPESRRRGPLHPSAYGAYFGLGGGQGQRQSAALLVLVVGSLALPDLVRVAAEIYLARILEEQGTSIGSASFMRFALLIALTFLLALVRSIVFTALARRSSRRVHDRVMDSICGASINQFFDVMPPGRLLNFLGKDMDAIDTLLPYQALEFLQDVAVLITALLVCIAVFPVVLVVVAPCALAFLRVRQLYSCSSRELMRMEASSRSPVLTMVAETIAGLPVIQAQGAAAGMRRRFGELVDRNAAFFMHVWMLMPWLALCVEQMVAAIFLAACASAILLQGVVGPALAAVALTNIMSLLSKVQMTCRQSVEVEKLLTAVERLAHLLDTVPAEEHPGSSIAKVEPPNDWPSAGHIRFEGACLRYRPGLPRVLTGLDLEVLPGKSVGLIGASGSGKSSCLRALLRLTELEAGRITIDGVDVASVPLRVLRRRVASVPQEPLLLTGSTRRNLLPEHAAHATDEDARCWDMLDLLGLGAAVRCWHEGLDTELAAGDQGALSLGQRQLLSLGRALLRGAAVLCVDEATAHVDGPTDAALQRALLESGRRRAVTRLTVAHRLWTLRHCDEVLLLRPGNPTSVHRISNPEREVVAI